VTSRLLLLPLIYLSMAGIRRLEQLLIFYVI